MITKFKLYEEKLGYSDEVGILTDFVWDRYKNYKYNLEKDFVMDLSEITKNMSFKINILKIKMCENEDFAMRAEFIGEEYRKNKVVILYQNIGYKKSKGFLEHELKHIYRFLMTNRRDPSYFKAIITEKEFYSDFIEVMYAVDFEEIQSYYQQDVRYYKEKGGRFRNFKYFLKGSNLNRWYSILKNFDINGYKNLSNEENSRFINIYNEIKDELNLRYKYEDKRIFKFIKNILKSPKDIVSIMNKYNFSYDVKHTDDQIDRFFQKFGKEIERAKKIYLSYFGKLYAYFN